jgi:uncharacterized protein (TIGR00369 family)
MSVGRDALIQFFEQGIAFNAWLGMRVEHLDDGACTLRVPFRAELVGDPFRPALHGGLLSTIGDAAGGLAVFSQAMNLETRVSTVDMRVDFLRPGRLEDVWCDARVVRFGNRVAVTAMVVRQAGDHVAAECRGVYNVVAPRR